MNFEPNEDQAAFLSAVERITAGHGGAWLPTNERHQHSPQLERDLEDSGFFACAQEPSLGPVAAAAMVMELSRLSVCAEVAASALIGPLVCPDLPRPLAVIWGQADRPTRFLPVARTVLRVDGNGVFSAALKAGDVVVLESAFAYPMGALKDASALAWKPVDNEHARRMQDLWRVGVAAEITGCLQAGLDSVVAHVTERRQFGRPLGSFQGIQHRLAAAASKVQAARWLTLKAAHSGEAVDAATAAGFAQGMATTISYDLHQFMGAMGLTLEHPLHRWTYRVKLLRAELGGAERQFCEVADLLWASAPA